MTILWQVACVAADRLCFHIHDLIISKHSPWRHLPIFCFSFNHKRFPRELKTGDVTLFRVLEYTLY